MYLQPSSMVMHEAEVHYDANPHQGPRQPGNDIDVYLKPLVEELLVLWNKSGVRVWDEYKQEHFEYQVCSAHQDIQLLFWSTFHLRKFRWFKFVIFKFQRLQTSFRNPRLSQIEKF